MADLRFRFIEDYAGGLLNISRQEISTTGEVLSQDGLTAEGTIFVEDGSGVKSGLKLGVSLAEVVDPTTESGIVNVRFADRTYAKVRDLRIFTTAIASAQSALSEATSTSLSNLETAFQLLEDDFNSLEENFQSNITNEREKIQELTINQNTFSNSLSVQESNLKSLESRVKTLETISPTAGTEEVAGLTIDLNSEYYTGTITIASGGIVSGTSTKFNDELKVGDIFIVKDSNNKDIEYKVTGFDTSAPATKMTVNPSNITITSATAFKRDTKRLLTAKINEIILALQNSDIFV